MTKIHKSKAVSSDSIISNVFQLLAHSSCFSPSACLVLLSLCVTVRANTFFTDKCMCVRRSMTEAPCRWLTDELVLHSIQQCLVGIIRLHGSGAFPCQHGANQMLSATWPKTHRHSWPCNINFAKLQDKGCERVFVNQNSPRSPVIYFDRVVTHVQTI